MARDKKASFKFSDVTDATGTLGQDAPADKLSTVITFSGSKAYVVASDVYRTYNMITGDAAAFGSQADTPAAGAADLVGINAQNQDLFVKVIYTNSAGITGAGTPILTIRGSDSATATDPGGALNSSVPISAAVTLSTTASASDVIYIPVMSSRPYWQLQIAGTTSSGGGTMTIVMAALVNGRDGSVSL